MKITQVAPYFNPHIGGVENHVYFISKFLLSKGHDVTVLTSLYDKALREKESIDGINVKRVKTIGTIFSTPITPGLKKFLGDEDIIHAHSPPPLSSYYAAKFCRKENKKFVLTYHCDLELPTFFGNLITSFYRKTFDRYTLNTAKKIIATSESYVSTSRALWNYETIIIPNGVDTGKFKPGLECNEIKEKYGENIVLYVGRLVYHKGLDVFIESAKYVDDAKYIVIGSGEMKAQLADIIEKFGLENKVELIGKVDSSTLPKYYSACNVFVLPSVSRLEAFGLVLLEAMACGKPVVASDMPGIREILKEGENGFLIEPFNAKKLAEKLNVLISDKKFAESLGANGRKIVEEKFSWSKICEKLEKVYYDL
ncbi:MAG: glycosyltransferase family 4 protein [Candidatus Thermoplasmatota archaeon]